MAKKKSTVKSVRNRKRRPQPGDIPQTGFSLHNDTMERALLTE
jgi:hypothetical protein